MKKKVFALHALRQYWDRLLGRFRPGHGVADQPDATQDLEREISAISSESHELAEAVQRVRADFEQARDEENRKIVHLEEVREAMQLAREEDQRKLAMLESLSDRYASDRESESRKLELLENRLDDLETERREAREQVRSLQAALGQAETRLEQASGQIRELQSHNVEQARQFQALLAEASERIEFTDNRVRALGSRLDTEHRQVLKTFEQLQDRFRRQDSRVNWTITAAVVALVIGGVAGAVLIWDVQNNAELLAGMRSDIRELTAAMNSDRGPRLSRQAIPQPPARPVPAPKVGAAPPSRPLAKMQPDTKTAPAARATISKPAINPYFLSSAMEGGRSTNREGIRQATRQDAADFFQENAKVPGMITLPSGVQYRVLRAGSGKSPDATGKVVLSYVGTKLDGTIIDETYSDGTPSTFGMNEVLPAWRDVLLKMEEGAEFELYIPPSQMSRGGVRNRGVTGFEPTLYLIELLQVVEDGAIVPAEQATR